MNQAILDLLQDGPQTRDVLAATLGQSTKQISAVLSAMKRDGLVKKIGRPAVRWVLATDARRGGRPKGNIELRAEILATLARGPQTLTALRSGIHVRKSRVRHVCLDLRTLGQLQFSGKPGSPRGLWALPGAVIPPSASPRSTYTPVRVTKVVKVIPRELAWWTEYAAPDANRDGFSTAAAQRNAEMLAAKNRTWREQDVRFS